MAPANCFEQACRLTACNASAAPSPRANALTERARGFSSSGAASSCSCATQSRAGFARTRQSSSGSLRGPGSSTSSRAGIARTRQSLSGAASFAVYHIAPGGAARTRQFSILCGPLGWLARIGGPVFPFPRQARRDHSTVRPDRRRPDGGYHSRDTFPGASASGAFLRGVA